MNISYAEEAGKTITNAQEIENMKISVRLRGKRIVLDKIQQNRSFSAYIDISAIDMDSSPDIVRLPVKIKTGLLASDYVDTEFISPSDIEVMLDDNVSQDFKVVPEFNGVADTGVSITGDTIEPDYVKVYGAQTEVAKVAEVRAIVNLESPHNGQKVTAALGAYDSSGNPVNGVYLSRDSASVTIRVETSRKIPVRVSYTGEPANGCSVGKVTASPDYVAVSGSPDVINDIMYVTLPDVDISGSGADVTKTFEPSAFLPQGAKVADSSSSKITVSVEITGQEEHNVSFDSEDIVITGEPAEGMQPAIEKDSFNIEVTGSGFDESLIRYSVDVTGLAEGEHRVQIGVELPEGLTLTGSAPYATVVVSGAQEANNDDTGGETE